MFVDASAIVAVLLREPGFERLLEILEDAESAVTSPLAVFEAACAVLRMHRRGVGDARRVVESFLTKSGVVIEPMTAATATIALDAFDRFGKGRGHPARLNMGDCFAYAMARQRNVPLLFTGGDFRHTDIAAAGRAIRRSPTP